MNVPDPTLSTPAPTGGSDTPPPARRTMRRGADREFLPAALEVIDTPPSPVGLVLLSAIALLVVIAIGWSWIGRIDVVAVAPGRIQPTGRVKVVQPIEPGKVIAVAVANGSHVAAGDLLFRLDSREASADVTGLRAASSTTRAEIQRRSATLAVVTGQPFEPRPPAWDADIPADIRTREEQVFFGDFDRLSSDRNALEAQETQKRAEVARLTAAIEAQRALLATHDMRVGMRSELVERAAGSKAQLLDAQEARQLQAVSLANLEGQLGETRAAIGVIETSRAQLLATFRNDQIQKLREAERLLDDLRERLNKALVRLEHCEVVAPIAGTVTALSINGVGQVVGASDEVMRIVPDGMRLELEAHVGNADIGFIEPGQSVAIKIDSFPYTRFGSVEGTIRRIAHDSVSDPDVQQSLASPSTATRSHGVGGTQRSQNLVYPVIVELKDQFISIEGRDVPLAPGMTAVAEIKTGSRRILEYILSPLVDVGSRAFKER